MRRRCVCNRAKREKDYDVKIRHDPARRHRNSSLTRRLRLGYTHTHTHLAAILCRVVSVAGRLPAAVVGADLDLWEQGAKESVSMPDLNSI